MILVDTGPLVALFDPKDPDHPLCRSTLKSLNEDLVTTNPVLTEAFHLLSPSSHGARKLMEFVALRGLRLWPLTDQHLLRAFELMIKYADCPMDLADASLVVIAEQEQVRRIFTIDYNDFSTYRIKRGHRHVPFQVIP